MLLTFVLLLFVTLGGMALSYVFQKEATLSLRIAIGHVVGSAVFGTVGFVIALILGDLTAIGVLAALTVATAPAVLFKGGDFGAALRREFKSAEGAMQGLSKERLLRFSFYLFFILLFLFFFDRAMIVRLDGIFTGASQNYGDLPAHLGAIFAFTEGGVFPPDNPSWAGAKFTYPFLLDFTTSMLMMLGAGVREAMYVQNVTLAVSLLVILEKFIAKVTGSQTVGKLGCVIFFFGGGLGFLAFFSDLTASGKGFLDFLTDLGRDYTIGKTFRWGNPLIVLFITQRSFLVGMPLTILAVWKAWKIFTDKRENFSDDSKALAGPFAAGLLTGTLPLVHVHSLTVVFIVCAVLFFFDLKSRWRHWIAFAVGVALIALPELIWITSGSATQFSKFAEFQWGWEDQSGGVLKFWVLNTGLLIPAVAAGIWLFASKAFGKRGAEAEITGGVRPSLEMLIFGVPFILIFLIGNFVKLAPWSWDNIKILVYWFVGMLPFICASLVYAWNRNIVLRVGAVIAGVVLCLSGAIDVWRVASKQIEFSVFDKDAVAIAEDIRLRTPEDALFLNAPTHNSPLVLTGRRSFIRHPGHLYSYGIDSSTREAEVKAIFAGGPAADSLMQRLGIEYVIVGPQEKSLPGFNRSFFSRYQMIAERGGHAVYKVR